MRTAEFCTEVFVVPNHLLTKLNVPESSSYMSPLNAIFLSKGNATFKLASRTGIRQGTLEIVIEEVLWSIRGSYQTIWSFPLTNVKWHSVTWPYTMTPPTDQTLYRTRPFTEFWVVSIEHLRRVWHADRGRLLLRTPGPVPLGLSYILIVETILFPNLSLFFRTLLFEYPSALSRFCSTILQNYCDTVKISFLYLHLERGVVQCECNIFVEEVRVKSGRAGPPPMKPDRQYVNPTMEDQMVRGNIRALFGCGGCGGMGGWVKSGRAGPPPMKPDRQYVNPTMEDQMVRGNIRALFGCGGCGGMGGWVKSGRAGPPPMKPDRQYVNPMVRESIRVLFGGGGEEWAGGPSAYEAGQTVRQPNYGRSDGKKKYLMTVIIFWWMKVYPEKMDCTPHPSCVTVITYHLIRKAL